MLVVSQLKKLSGAGHFAGLCLVVLSAAACGEPPAAPITLTDASTSQSAMSPTAPPKAAPQACNFEGTWALRVVLPVYWEANFAMQQGEGNIIQYARVDRVAGPESNIVHETIRPCGITVPPLQRQLTGNSERYLFAFRNTIFDDAAENFQPAEIFSLYADGFHSNAEFLSDYAALQLGVALDNPLTDPWPQADHRLALLPFGRRIGNGDDLPVGMPSRAWTGNGYRRPMMGLRPGSPRLKTAFFAMRNVERINARHVSCNRAEGTVEVRQMDNGIPALNLALLECVTAEENGAQCTPAQINVFNEHLPQMIPFPQGSSVTLVRVDAGISCRDISHLNYNNVEAHQLAPAQN